MDGSIGNSEIHLFIPFTCTHFYFPFFPFFPFSLLGDAEMP